MKRGKIGVQESIEFMDKRAENDMIRFYDKYIFGGYGKSDEILNSYILKMANEKGILLDNTYTGKAFFGMTDIIKNKRIRGSVIFSGEIGFWI